MHVQLLTEELQRAGGAGGGGGEGGGEVEALKKAVEEERAKVEQEQAKVEGLEKLLQDARVQFNN
jgi:hypothetical protein